MQSTLTRKKEEIWFVKNGRVLQITTRSNEECDEIIIYAPYICIGRAFVNLLEPKIEEKNIFSTGGKGFAK